MSILKLSFEMKKKKILTKKRFMDIKLKKDLFELEPEGLCWSLNS